MDTVLNNQEELAAAGKWYPFPHYVSEKLT